MSAKAPVAAADKTVESKNERRLAGSMVDLAKGLQQHLTGIALLVSNAHLLKEAAQVGLLSAALASGTAVSLWVLLALPAYVFGSTMTMLLDALLLPCSLFVMYMVPPMFPHQGSRVFFCALSALSESEASRLRSLRELRGLASQLRALGLGLLAGVGAIALLFTTAPFWLPAAAAGVVAIAAVSPFLVPFLAAGVFLVAWCTNWLRRRIAVFTVLSRISVAVAIFISLCWMVGLISLEAVQLIGKRHLDMCSDGVTCTLRVGSFLSHFDDSA